MNDSQLRTIIRQEIANQTSQNRFRLSTNNRHVHNGLDSPNINQNNIIPGLRVEGSIRFQHTGVYKIATNFNPSSMLVHGNATNIRTGGTQRYVIIGNAQLGGQSFYLQPSTANSVTVGGRPQTIIQSTTYFGTEANGNASAFHTLTDETHIVDVSGFPTSGDIYARMTVTSFDNQAIYLTVDNLAAGWEIDLSLTIT